MLFQDYINDKTIALKEAVMQLESFNNQHEKTAAQACIGVLNKIASTPMGWDRREAIIQEALDCSHRILPQLGDTSLKCELLITCYRMVEMDALLDEAKRIIISWGGRELTAHEEEMMQLWNVASNSR